MTDFDPSAGHSLAEGFRDVDASDVARMAQCLTYLDSLPPFQRYKKLTFDAMNLRHGSIVADLGCGLGYDVRRLSMLVGPHGRVIGVDSSLALIESARSANGEFSAAEFVHGDIQNLPFEQSFLHSCRVDRVLQHVERPAAVLEEMFRTVRPGGMVVCAEPDWATFTINHENRTMARQIADAWSESFRHPRIGRQLKHNLREAGCVEAETQEFLLVAPSFNSSEIVFDLYQTASRVATSTGSEEPLAWLSEAREHDAVAPLSSSVMLLVNIAKRP